MVMALTSLLVTTDRNNNTRVISFRISFYVFRSTFSISEVTCVSKYLHASKHRWDAHMANSRVRKSSKLILPRAVLISVLRLSRNHAWVIGKIFFCSPARGRARETQWKKAPEVRNRILLNLIANSKNTNTRDEVENHQRPEKWARKRKLPLISISFELFSSRAKVET